MKIKDFISKNWDIFDNKFKQIKKNQENTLTFQIKNFDVTISYPNFKYSIKFHDNENNEIFKTLISKFSRKINFKKLNKNNWNIVFDEIDIGAYIKKLNLIHPTFFNKEKKKSESIRSEDYEQIFTDESIIEISDDEYARLISKNEFIQFKLRDTSKKISDIYLNIPEDNISQSLNNDTFIETNERSKVLYKLISFIGGKEKDKLFWLSGGKKIGKTVTIRYSIIELNLFYFNFKIIKSKNHSSDIKKIIFRECMNLFNDKTYNNFYEFFKKIESIKGYKKNIFDLLLKYCEYINNEKNIDKPIIILDDYDDIYMDENEIMNENIINSLLKFSKLKYIICGNGKLINNLALTSLTGINDYYKFNSYNYVILYYNDFEIKINNKKVTNLLYEVDKKKCEEEFKRYFEKKYNNNKNELLLKLITFEELIRMNYEFKLNDILLNELPIQFFKIIYNKEKNIFYVNYLYEEEINTSNQEIQSLVTKKAEININLDEHLRKLPKLEECLFERLIILSIETNSFLKNMFIPNENIIKVEEIYNINENNIDKKENIIDNCPILIKQNKEGAYYDFALIIEKDKKIYGILIQIGLNKKKTDISTIFSYTSLNYETLIKGLNKLIGKNIDFLSLLFIFNKEKQDNLLKQLKDNKKNKIKQYIYIGKEYTKEFFIPYLEFSNKNKQLYLEKNIIDDKEQFLKSFWPIINYQGYMNHKIDKLLSIDYKEFSDNLIKYFNYENIFEIKILFEISDYRNILNDLSQIFLIIFILNDEILIINKEKKEKQYLLYNNKKHFESLTQNKFLETIKDNKKEIFLCEKIFKEEEENLFFEEQKLDNEKIELNKIKKRKVESGYKEERKKIEKEKYKNKQRYRKQPQNRKK